jgi:hypothetical protein
MAMVEYFLLQRAILPIPEIKIDIPQTRKL